MTKVPYMAVSKEELDDARPVGKEAYCFACGKMHPVRGNFEATTKDADGTERRVERDVIQVIRCPETKKSYLVGIDGKSVVPPRYKGTSREDEMIAAHAKALGGCMNCG